MMHFEASGISHEKRLFESTFLKLFNNYAFNGYLLTIIILLLLLSLVNSNNSYLDIMPGSIILHYITTKDVSNLLSTAGLVCLLSV